MALQFHSIDEVKVKNKINSLILYKKWQTEKSILVDCCFYVLAKCVIKIKCLFCVQLRKNSANYLFSVEEAFNFLYENYAKFNLRDN
ncbi:hypothetical protein TYA12_14030, partial [Proteus mirabilis]|uniref:hypothetical protein n=1 Tax=Proteus mirabilis TaxID=584 RepID=UPI002AB4CD14